MKLSSINKFKLNKMAIFFLCFLTLSIILNPIIALAAENEVENNTPSGELIPSISELYEMSDNKYFNTYKDNYYLDLEETGLFKGLTGKLCNVIANFFFSLEILLCQLVIVIVYYTFEISVFDIFNKPINAIIGNMQDTIFNEFMYLALGTILIYYVVKSFRSQNTQIWSAIITSIVILALALAFFRAPVTVLKSLNDVTDSISQSVLDGTYSAANEGAKSESVTESITNNLWTMFVHNPWQIYEFGSVKVASEFEDKILSMQPESDERQEYINEIAEKYNYFGSNMGYLRAPISIVFFIIFLVVAAVIVCLCGLMFGYQFMSMLYATFGPLIFLIALIPFFGLNTLRKWASKVIGFTSLKIILSLIIAVLFSFIMACFELVDEYGLLIMSLIIALIVIVVWVKRDSIIDGFFKMTTMAKEVTPQNFRRATRYDYSNRNNARNYFKSGNNTGGGNSSNNSGNAQRNQTNQGNQNNQSNKSNKNNGNKSKTNKYNPNYANKEFSEGINSVNNNLVSLRHVAEEILEERFNNSKQESEVKAAAMNKEPEYSPWVKQVMNRDDMNLPKFEEREKQAVVQQIMDIRKNGGDISDLTTEENTLTTSDVLSPTSVVNDSPVKMKRVNTRKTDREASGEFINTFNTEFGKNYKEDFMNNLVTTYGQDNVGQVINDMVRINKTSEIKNPTGYILSSLKNNMDNENSSEDIHESISMTSVEVISGENDAFTEMEIEEHALEVEVNSIIDSKPNNENRDKEKIDKNSNTIKQVRNRGIKTNANYGEVNKMDFNSGSYSDIDTPNE